MSKSQEASGEILPPNPIRVETALSRYPVHRLAKKGDININIRRTDERGITDIKWEVKHSPGPLAYKIDTLIVNRRIEEAPRPIPKIIRLGSQRDFCRALDRTEGENVNAIREAMRQNAFAGITAKIRYRQNDGTETTLDTDFTRYSVIFTGQKLPDGRKADAIYIVLNDIYMQVLNGAMTRPLDYDYLKTLPPAAQRFYELLSYQMYATIKNDRARAKLLYSEFCTYAPLTRYPKFDQVKKQMYKIHSMHRESGYIAKVDYQQTTDADGQPDWIMLYQPGLKARAEFRAFTKRGGPVMLEAGPFTANPLPKLTPPAPSPLEAELIGRGITPAIAGELLHEHGEEKVRLQIDILDSLPKKKRDKIADPAAYLVIAIRNGHAVPKDYISKAERERQAEAKRQAEQKAAEDRRREREEAAREKAERQAINAYWTSLSSQQQVELEAAALAQADADTLALIKGPTRRIGLTIVRDQYIRQLLNDRQPEPTKA